MQTFCLRTFLLQTFCLRTFPLHILLPKNASIQIQRQIDSFGFPSSDKRYLLLAGRFSSVGRTLSPAPLPPPLLTSPHLATLSLIGEPGPFISGRLSALIRFARPRRAVPRLTATKHSRGCQTGRGNNPPCVRSPGVPEVWQRRTIRRIVKGFLKFGHAALVHRIDQGTLPTYSRMIRSLRYGQRLRNDQIIFSDIANGIRRCKSAIA